LKFRCFVLIEIFYFINYEFMESTNQSFEAFGVLLTKAQELYVRSIKNIVGIALLVYIPMGIITYLVEQYYFS